MSHLADNLPTYVTNVQHGQGWVGRVVAVTHTTSLGGCPSLEIEGDAGLAQRLLDFLSAVAGREAAVA